MAEERKRPGSGFVPQIPYDKSDRPSSLVPRGDGTPLDALAPSAPVVSSGGWAGAIEGGIVRAGFSGPRGEQKDGEVIYDPPGEPFEPYSMDDANIVRKLFGVDWD